MKNGISGRKVISILMIVFGIILSIYPLISSIVEHEYQKTAVATYTKEVEASRKEDTEKYFHEADTYNSMLYQSAGVEIDKLSNGILSQDSYNHMLNISGTGVMGSIDIPKINVNLPIYHGVSDEVLSSGVGHLEGSSLPVGGVNTRTVLTGHRGLPSSKLFTRLDEMEQGDLFFINVLGKTLAYQVSKLEVIKPEETDLLGIVPEKDLASLITCTPYGINTHRLVVTGERIEYQPKEHEMIKSERMSFREILFTVTPFIFIGITMLLYGKNRKREV